MCATSKLLFMVECGGKVTILVWKKAVKFGAKILSSWCHYLNLWLACKTEEVQIFKNFGKYRCCILILIQKWFDFFTYRWEYLSLLSWLLVFCWLEIHVVDVLLQGYLIKDKIIIFAIIVMMMVMMNIFAIRQHKLKMKVFLHN